MRSRMFCPRASGGGRDLARAAGVLRLRREGSRYRYRRGDRILNWGSTEGVRGVPDSAYLNKPVAVARAVDKVYTYYELEQCGIPVPERTRNWTAAWEWLKQGHKVMRRRTMSGSQGRGIKVFSLEGSDYSQSIEDFETVGHLSGSTYVKVFGQHPGRVIEFRVHADREHVFDFQMKRKRNGTERFDPYVRSSENGWVFCREGTVLPAVLRSTAVQAVRALGLDFAAVDCAVEFDSAESAREFRRDGRLTGPSSAGRANADMGDELRNYVIYELNTAPGLDGSTLDAYASLVRTKLRVANG